MPQWKGRPTFIWLSGPTARDSQRNMGTDPCHLSTVQEVSPTFEGHVAAIPVGPETHLRLGWR